MLITATDLVKKSYELYKKNLRLFLIYALIISVPSMAVALLGGMFAAVFNWQSYTFVTVLYAILFFVLSVIAYFISLWFSLAFLKAVAAHYEEKEAQTYKEAIESTKQFIIPVFIASVLAGLVILGGFILLIIPGIIFSVWFTFVIYAVLLDGQKSTAALRYSKKLVQGRWWGVLWRILVPTSIFLIISGGLEMPLDYLLKYSDSTIINYIVILVSSIISIVLTPFIVSAQTILYLELKKTRATSPVSASAPNGPPV